MTDDDMPTAFSATFDLVTARLESLQLAKLAEVDFSENDSIQPRSPEALAWTDRLYATTAAMFHETIVLLLDVGIDPREAFQPLLHQLLQAIENGGQTIDAANARMDGEPEEEEEADGPLTAEQRAEGYNCGTRLYPGIGEPVSLRRGDA